MNYSIKKHRHVASPLENKGNHEQQLPKMCSSCSYRTLRNPLPAEEELETQKATFKGFSFAERQATM